eukprot:g7494.t1
MAHNHTSLAWKHFLCLDLPHEILTRVLKALPKSVMPYLSSPLGLSDFLTSALDQGGFIGLLALHGIFLLVTEHNLEYPDFYKRVYNLLSLEVFSWKDHQSKFFKMLNAFLKSELIPAYTVAAFVKKFARLAIQTNPSGAIICITFIHNLIRRHPACYSLLHKESTTNQEITSWKDYDCYDDSEPEPSQSRAIESSLWEIEALGNHWCPQVANHAEILLKDLTRRTNSSEESLQMPLRVSYGALFEQCVNKGPTNPQVMQITHFCEMSFSSYATHIPLKSWQKTTIAVISGIGSLLNPHRADLVAASNETLGAVAFRRVHESLSRSPEGLRILTDRPIITDSTLEQCRKLQSGTFGAAYARFMDERSFRPSDRPPVRFIDDPDIAYVALRYRQVHDLWHVLYGCSTNITGEVAVKIIEGIQVCLLIQFCYDFV